MNIKKVSSGNFQTFWHILGPPQNFLKQNKTVGNIKVNVWEEKYDIYFKDQSIFSRRGRNFFQQLGPWHMHIHIMKAIQGSDSFKHATTNHSISNDQSGLPGQWTAPEKHRRIISLN